MVIYQGSTACYERRKEHFRALNQREPDRDWLFFAVWVGILVADIGAWVVLAKILKVARHYLGAL